MLGQKKTGNDKLFRLKILWEVYNFELLNYEYFQAKITWGWCICIFSVIFKCSGHRKTFFGVEHSVQTEHLDTMFPCTLMKNINTRARKE